MFFRIASFIQTTLILCPLFISGGAGVGDPAVRDPEKVRMDVINGFISVEQAKEKYKVALNPQTLEIDQHRTRQY